MSPASTSTRNEYGSASNNDSLDAGKGEKVKLKNQKKHQRRREKPARELHIRCTEYLKSRKLEALAQPLVAMGFPSERATMAFILNGGDLEESVAWLLQQGEENNEQQVVANIEDGGANLKVDISDELARMAGLEIKFSCSKQEVERAVVSCQGDLDKAEDSLKAQKQQQSVAAAAAHPKMEESDPGTSNSKREVSSGVPMARSQVNGVASHHHGVDERNFSHTVSMVAEEVLKEATNGELLSSTARRTGPGSFRNSIHSSSSSLLAAPSSLGLFSGLHSLASSGKSCPVDWTTGASMPQRDYATIDWSPDLTSMGPLTKADRSDPQSLDTMPMGGEAAARPNISGGTYVVVGSQETGGLMASQSSSSAVPRDSSDSEENEV